MTKQIKIDAEDFAKFINSQNTKLKATVADNDSIRINEDEE